MRYIVKEVFPQGASVVLTGEVWNDGSNLGKRQVALSAIAVMWIVTDELLTDPQKKAAIRALVVAQVQSWRLTEAYEAADAVRDLAPAFPITLTFDPAPLPEPPGNGEMQALGVETGGKSLVDTVKGWFK